MNQYETVFILTPVLSDDQMKEAVNKFKDVMSSLSSRQHLRQLRSWRLHTVVMREYFVT